MKRRILLAEITAGVPQPQVFATWNPADKHADIALSGGNLIAEKSTAHATDWACVRGTLEMTAGQWYWETTVNFTGTADFRIGLATTALWLLDAAPGDLDPLGFLHAVAAVRKNGDILSGGVVIGSVGAVSSGAVIRHWFDKDTYTYKIANAGGAWVTVVPSPGSWGRFTQLPIVGFQMPALSTASCTANFGATPFAYTPPDGANAGIYTQPSTPTTLYLGSEGFDATIDSAPVHFMGRIAGDQDVEIEREGSCWPWGNKSLSRRGQLVVINNDGVLDAWREYRWRDAPAILRAGWEGDAYDDFTVWAFSRVDTIELTRDSRIVLSFVDPVAWLDRQIQTDLYPADQANLQLAGQPLPIVYGSPLYCTANRLDTNPTVRDYQLHDQSSGDVLTEIAKVFDSGDLFAGPDDTFVPHDAVTAANGGDFGGWSGTPAYPANWEAPPGSGVFGPNDKFADAGTIYMQCISLHAPVVEMQHAASTLQANRLYRITFTCSSILAAGSLYFGVYGSPDTAIPLSTTGAKSVALYVKDAGKLRIKMKGDGINVVIHTLRASAEQVIDWTYWGGTRGFTLANTPYGKIVANPVGPNDILENVAADVAERVSLPDIVIDGVTTPGLDVDTATAIDSSPQRKVSAYLNEPKTGLELLTEMVVGFGGFITSSRLGQIVFGKIKEPASTALLTLDETNIAGEIIVTTDVAKDLSIRLCGGANNTVHTATDIATGVPEDLAAELQKPYLHTVTGASNASIPVSSAYAAAIAAPAQETLLMETADLQAEANRIATLWRPTRNFYLVTAILEAAAADDYQLEPGQTVRLVWPRWGLEAGKNLLVVGIRTRFFSRRVQFKLWG